MGPIRETVFKNGEAVPESTPNKLRLYSMRLCPFAQRTRLVLAHKNIEHETVNVHLKEKPDWFLEKNPLGLVPVLEKNDTIVYESGICDDYLDELFPNRPLYPNDPYQKARVKILMERFGKVISSFYGTLRAADEEQRQEVMKNLESYLNPFEEALEGKFFGGDEISMLDIHTWPWFERMDAMKVGVDIIEKLPKLKTWVQNMKNHPTVQATLFSEDIHNKFVESYRVQKPNYDIGL